MELLKEYLNHAAEITEFIGIAIIFVGVVYSLLNFIIIKIKSKENCYKKLRISLGKCILLGLEILIAADIMATVVSVPDLNKVLTLGLVVLIRIVLSLSLQVELEGQFPWQKKSTKDII